MMQFSCLASVVPFHMRLYAPVRAKVRYALLRPFSPSPPIPCVFARLYALNHTRRTNKCHRLYPDVTGKIILPGTPIMPCFIVQNRGCHRCYRYFIYRGRPCVCLMAGLVYNLCYQKTSQRIRRCPGDLLITWQGEFWLINNRPRDSINDPISPRAIQTHHR